MADRTRRRSSLSQLVAGVAGVPLMKRRACDYSIDITPLEADLLVSYQLEQSDFKYLTPLAFSVARVVPTEKISQRVHAVLRAVRILLAGADAEVSEDGGNQPVDTTKIDRSFAKQLYFISAYTQRRVVALLFWWEEEFSRFQALSREDVHIREALAQAPAEMQAELKLRLEAVSMKKRLLPSQRGETTENVSTGVQEELPAYG